MSEIDVVENDVRDLLASNLVEGDALGDRVAIPVHGERLLRSFSLAIAVDAPGETARDFDLKPDSKIPQVVVPATHGEHGVDG